MAIQLYTTIGALCGTFVCGTTLCGAPSDLYSLPSSLTIQEDDADFRFREEERVFQHGSVAFGEEWAARDITVSGIIQGETTTEAADLVKAIRSAAARLDQRLRLSSSETRFLELARLRRMDARPRELTGRRLFDVRITWRACTPFWHSQSSSNHTEALAGDATFVVDAGDVATVAMHPLITITAPVGAAVPSVRLTNATDEDQAFLYEDLALEDGASVVIDCAAGTVARDGTSSIRYFSGAFPRLLPGENSLSYEGNACTITLTWRPRWI